MADKAKSDSVGQTECHGLAAARLARLRFGAAGNGALAHSDPRWTEGVLGARRCGFPHPARGRQDRVNANTPYFIHIVRANRADDLLGPGLGVSRAGQHEKQTVAG
jgi:hypothetical protein